MMRSARERPEAESQLEEVAPPRVRKSREEETASTLSRFKVRVKYLWDGGVTVHEFEPESESEWESQEELEEPEPKVVLTRSDRFSLQVTNACVTLRAHLLDPD